MSTSLVPFGKYKGQPVEVLANDRAYCEWLAGQDWFRTRFAAIHTLIVNNFGAPAETPEHNALQARFLDPAWCERFVLLCSNISDPVRVIEENRVAFLRQRERTLTDYNAQLSNPHRYDREQLTEWRDHAAEDVARLGAHGQVPEFAFDTGFEVDGADVDLSANVFYNGVSFIDAKRRRIECKPSLGDDYPAVLRQMKANTCTVLLIDAFAATGAAFDQVRAIFKTSGISVVTVAEVESTPLLTERMGS